MMAAFLAILLVCLSSGLVTAGKQATLDEDGKYKITWSFDGLGKDNHITFNIEAETTGWVGLGVSPNGGMKGADIVVAWIDSNGKAFIDDMYASAKTLPVKDSTDDVTLLSSEEKNGKTTISFKRKLNTCDINNDLPITNDTTRLIFAWGVNDPANNVLTNADYHSSTRGSKSLYLLESVSYETSLPSDIQTHDMLVENYAIPSDSDTTYYCSFQKAPQLNRIHHVVAIETMVQPGNEGLVHHLILYGCWNVTDEHIRGSNKTGGICNTPNMPEFAKSCTSLSYAWAVGGTKFYYPSHVGMPIGESDSPQYYMMEIHYDNPRFESGRTDSSGVRLIYTPTLRKSESGVMEVGYVEGIFVPPKTKKFDTVGFCHESCTERVPGNGVKLLAYALHSHLIGSAIKIDWYRGDSYLGVMASDDKYDFNYQEFRYFREEITLMPGDTLKISCSMDSTTRTNVTFGGLPSSSEMCLAFFIYYPRQDMGVCMSYPTYLFDAQNPLYSTLGITPSQGAYGNFSYRTELGNVVWTSDLVSRSQEIVQKSPQGSYCRSLSDLPHDSGFTTFESSKYQNVEKVKDDICEVKGNDCKASAASLVLILGSLSLVLGIN